MAKIVVALGGNALSKDGKATAADQLAVANETASELVNYRRAHSCHRPW